MSSASTDSSAVPPEVRILQTVQGTVGALPGATSVARGMSHFGEHALGWIAIGAVGALVDPKRRTRWAGVAVGAVGAHAASIVIKRIVRRKRRTTRPCRSTCRRRVG